MKSIRTELSKEYLCRNRKKNLKESQLIKTILRKEDKGKIGFANFMEDDIRTFTKGR